MPGSPETICEKGNLMKQRLCRNLFLVGAFVFASMSVITNGELWAGTAPDQLSATLKAEIEAEYAGTTPKEWGETVSGVKTFLKTNKRVIALTFDACGSPKGKGIDLDLIHFLEQEKIPATLFINARWIDANPELFLKLAANPLFTIANHGFLHRPASVNGRSIYGIDGTRNISELVDEIELNARKIEQLTGTRPVYYRSGTAYYDELAVKIAERLGHQVVGFSVLGDAGATFSREQVTAALLTSGPGSIVILHMNHPESGTGQGVMTAVPLLKKSGFRFVSLTEYPLQ